MKYESILTSEALIEISCNYTVNKYNWLARSFWTFKVSWMEAINEKCEIIYSSILYMSF